MAHQTLEAISWDLDAEAHLEGVGGLPASEYARMVADDPLTVLGIYEAEKRVGTCLMRWEIHEGSNHKEAVIVAAGGAAEGDITLNCMPIVIDVARQLGADFMRVHTSRPGLVRKLAPQASGTEFIMRWGL